MALPTPATGIRSEASSSTSRTPMVRSRISSSVLFDFILGGADKPLMVMLPLDAENEDRGGGEGAHANPWALRIDISNTKSSAKR